MLPSNQLMFVRQTLYALKRDYGYALDLYKVSQSAVDNKTGKRTRTRTVHKIRKAIVLPSTLARKFHYDLSYIAANKNFTYGDHYDLNSRLVIVDAIDIRNVEITIDDGVMFEHKRYQVKQLERLEYNLGYLLTLTQTVGAIPAEVFELRVESPLQIAQSAAGAL